MDERRRSGLQDCAMGAAEFEDDFLNTFETVKINVVMVIDKQYSPRNNSLAESAVLRILPPQTSPKEASMFTSLHHVHTTGEGAAPARHARQSA